MIHNSWAQSMPITDPYGDHAPPTDPKTILDQAIKEQGVMGWRHAMRGYLSTSWASCGTRAQPRSITNPPVMAEDNSHSNMAVKHLNVGTQKRHSTLTCSLCWGRIRILHQCHNWKIVPWEIGLCSRWSPKFCNPTCNSPKIFVKVTSTPGDFGQTIWS